MTFTKKLWGIIMREKILDNLWTAIKIFVIIFGVLNGIFLFSSVLESEIVKLLFSTITIITFSYFVLRTSLKNFSDYPDINFENYSRRNSGELEKLVKKVEFARKGYSLSQETLRKRIEKIFDERNESSGEGLNEDKGNEQELYQSIG